MFFGGLGTAVITGMIAVGFGSVLAVDLGTAETSEEITAGSGTAEGGRLGVGVGSATVVGGTFCSSDSLVSLFTGAPP